MEGDKNSSTLLTQQLTNADSFQVDLFSCGKKINSSHKYSKEAYQHKSKKTRLNIKSISFKKNVNKASDSESSQPGSSVNSM